MLAWNPRGSAYLCPMSAVIKDMITTTVWVSHLLSAWSLYPAEVLSQFTVTLKLTPDSSKLHSHIWSGFLSSSWSTWLKYSFIPRGFLAFTGFPPSFSDMGTLCSSLIWWKALVVAVVGCYHGWLLVAPLDFAPVPSALCHLFQRPAQGWGLVFLSTKDSLKHASAAFPATSICFAFFFWYFSISAIISNFYSFACPSWSIWLEWETRMKAPSKHFGKYMI